MTRRTKYALSGLVAVAALAACGKLTSESTNFLNKKYFDAWVTVCRTDNPEYIWSRTALGSYLLRDIPGSGKLASAEEAPYLQVEYNLRTLDGSLVGTTSRALDKQEYGDISGDESYYYGPAFWYTGSNNLYASYEELIFGDGKELEPMKTGGERTAVLPGWLLTQKRYKTEKEYLNNITGTDYILTVKVIGQVKDIRKWEIDSHCYPIRLAYGYWKKTGDASVFDSVWIEAMHKVLATLKEQQRKDGPGPYYFTRVCDRQYDMKCNYGYGNPVNPVGLIVSSFRPSDDATVLDFLVPSNFFAVTSLRKAAEILETVNGEKKLAGECRALASEVEEALGKYAVVEQPGYGKVYAYEVDGFGNALRMDDSNVPSLLAMAYLGDVDINDEIYRNTRNFVLGESNPYRFEGAAGAGIGGPHIGPDYIWPMSIMMRAFTSQSDEEIQDCIIQLMNTDAGTGFMHEAFNVDDPGHYTRDWFAWQNTLFGELILKLLDDGKLELLNAII